MTLQQSFVRVVRAVPANGWLQRRRILRESLKIGLRAVLRLATLGRGLEKNIGNAGAFRMDYAFAFVSYDGWGQAHNRGFGTVIDLCSGKRVVFDVGAHVGLYTKPMSRAVGSGGTIYAFEPARVKLSTFDAT